MINSKIVSSLVKVFKDKNPISYSECNVLTALKNDTVSFQVVYVSDETLTGTVEIASAFGRHAVVRSVEFVPVTVPGRPEDVAKDGNYVLTGKGEAPDYLRPLRSGKLRITRNKYRTVRIDVEVPARFKAGEYDVRVTLRGADGTALCENVQKITVYDAVLPEATLKHTEWFHTDCIADYYGYTVWSEEHWNAVSNYMKTAAKRGINMILTPVFTPPLDTEIGGERTTVQLCDVYLNGDEWSFGFERLDRWVATAQAAGVKYFEINHLFTQWGANAAPKVMATVDGEYKRVFGWDTLVADGKYPEFLGKFLPALTAHLRKLGIAENCYFHVSDEPDMNAYDNYMRAKNIIAPYLEGFKLMDALSHYEFYETGACEHPIPNIGHTKTFVDHNVPELWTYYCCGPATIYTNRFIAMTLARTRAIGLQLFKFRIEGFLHWGYNFYNSCYSRHKIDPYKVNNGEATGWAGGDPFVVYPAPGGKTYESIRLMAFFEAEQDLRALQALGAKTSHEYVVSLIEEDLGFSLEFDRYPTSEYYYIRLRNKINRELAK